MSDDEKGDAPSEEGLPPVGSEVAVIMIEAGPMGIKYKHNCGMPEQVLSILRTVELQLMHEVFSKWTVERAIQAQIAQGSGSPLVPQ